MSFQRKIKRRIEVEEKAIQKAFYTEVAKIRAENREMAQSKACLVCDEYKNCTREYGKCFKVTLQPTSTENMPTSTENIKELLSIMNEDSRKHWDGGLSLLEDANGQNPS